LKLPRDLSGADLASALIRLGYVRVRQAGSHVRLEHAGPPPHAVTIPLHDFLKIGTLSAILNEVAGHLKISRDQILAQS